MATWACPACRRRVPERVAVCHCGTTRDQAASAPPPVPQAGASTPRGSPFAGEGTVLRGVLRGAWPYVVLFVLAFTGALVWGVLWRPTPIPPILGYARLERALRAAKPTPSPRPASASPR